MLRSPKHSPVEVVATREEEGEKEEGNSKRLCLICTNSNAPRSKLDIHIIFPNIYPHFFPLHFSTLNA
jgi:hypothetical protein